jgi:putative toxin-antitoxin system antitoxin component (TIGR02293 family)
MTETECVMDLLGGRKVFNGRGPSTTMQLRERVRAGLPYRSLESIRVRLNLPLSEAAAVLGVPLRTLARRRHRRRLDARESDRLYRWARIAGHDVGALGTDQKAAAWLRRPNRALSGEAPLALLDTDIGARQVEDVLGRIERGVVG